MNDWSSVSTRSSNEENRPEVPRDPLRNTITAITYGDMRVEILATRQRLLASAERIVKEKED